MHLNVHWHLCTLLGEIALRVSFVFDMIHTYTDTFYPPLVADRWIILYRSYSHTLGGMNDAMHYQTKLQRQKTEWSKSGEVRERGDKIKLQYTEITREKNKTDTDFVQNHFLFLSIFGVSSVWAKRMRSKYETRRCSYVLYACMSGILVQVSE